MVSAWDRLEVRVNRRVAATFPTSMSYADTAGHTDSFVAVFDEQYEVLAVGTDGVVMPMTRPVVTAQIADFATTTPEADGFVTIGTRAFSVDSVERIGHHDLRLILTEIK